MPKGTSLDIQWFLNELASRVVAQTGIASDRNHMGKIILQSLKNAPEFLLQIDGGTGEKDTFKSALERSIRCATALRNLGLTTNDVIAVMGPNYLDLPIVIYAGSYLGVAVAGFDNRHSISEYRSLFGQCPPKVVFCTAESVNNVQKALESIDVVAHIITFKKTDNYLSFHEFLDKYSDNKPPEEFIPSDLDPSDTNLIIVSTSGTTGLPKITPLTHLNVMIGFPMFISALDNYPTPTKLGLCVSPIQWMSAHLMYILPVLTRFTRLQTSLPVTPEHTYELINKYRPTYTIASPPFMTTLLKPGDRDRCDFSCLETIGIGGSAVTPELIDIVKKVMPNANLYTPYGMSESTGAIFIGEDPTGRSCGRELGNFKYRLVDPYTEQDVTEANKSGELWVKGPTVFKGYYNNPEANALAFADGWLKTGDLFYRDEHLNYYFVDRLKLLLKYKNDQISPLEIEKLIVQHPAVLDVAVTGIPDDEAGDLPVACIILQNGYKITAQEIKDLVKAELSYSKQLRGGVVFLKELPLTSSHKVDRSKLKVLVKSMDRQ